MSLLDGSLFSARKRPPSGSSFSNQQQLDRPISASRLAADRSQTTSPLIQAQNFQHSPSLHGLIGSTTTLASSSFAVQQRVPPLLLSASVFDSNNQIKDGVNAPSPALPLPPGSVNRGDSFSSQSKPTAFHHSTSSAVSRTFGGLGLELNSLSSPQVKSSLGSESSELSTPGAPSTTSTKGTRILSIQVQPLTSPTNHDPNHPASSASSTSSTSILPPLPALPLALPSPGFAARPPQNNNKSPANAFLSTNKTTQPASPSSSMQSSAHQALHSRPPSELSIPDSDEQRRPSTSTSEESDEHAAALTPLRSSKSFQSRAMPSSTYSLSLLLVNHDDDGGESIGTDSGANGSFQPTPLLPIIGTVKKQTDGGDDHDDQDETTRLPLSRSQNQTTSQSPDDGDEGDAEEGQEEDEEDEEDDEERRLNQFSADSLNAWLAEYREENNGEDNPAYGMMVDMHYVLSRIRFWTDCCFVLALLGLIFMIAAREVEFRRAIPFSFFFSSSSSSSTSLASTAVFVLRCLTSFTTLLLLISLFCLHQIESRSEQIHRYFLFQLEHWPTRRLVTFLIEACILIIHDPPELNILVSMDAPLGSQSKENDILDPKELRVANPWTLLMFLRIYLVIRLVLARYYPAGPKVLGRWCHFDFTTPFAVRNMLASHATASFSLLLFSVIFTFSYCLHACERVAGGKHATFGGSVWVVLITLPTIGYGDIVPVTVCGRFVLVLTAVAGITLLASLFSAVNEFLTLAPYETRVVEMIDLFRIKDQRRQSAASVIAFTWRLWKARSTNSLMRYYYRYRLVEAMDRSFECREQLSSFGTRLDTAQYMRLLLDQISSGVEKLADASLGKDREPAHVTNPIVAQLILIFSRRKSAMGGMMSMLEFQQQQQQQQELLLQQQQQMQLKQQATLLSSLSEEFKSQTTLDGNGIGLQPMSPMIGLTMSGLNCNDPLVSQTTRTRIPTLKSLRGLNIQPPSASSPSSSSPSSSSPSSKPLIPPPPPPPPPTTDQSVAPNAADSFWNSIFPSSSSSSLSNLSTVPSSSSTSALLFPSNSVEMIPMQSNSFSSSQEQVRPSRGSWVTGTSSSSSTNPSSSIISFLMPSSHFNSSTTSSSASSPPSSNSIEPYGALQTISSSSLLIPPHLQNQPPQSKAPMQSNSSLANLHNLPGALQSPVAASSSPPSDFPTFSNPISCSLSGAAVTESRRPSLMRARTFDPQLSPRGSKRDLMPADEEHSAASLLLAVSLSSSSSSSSSSLTAPSSSGTVSVLASQSTPANSSTSTTTSSTHALSPTNTASSSSSMNLALPPMPGAGKRPSLARLRSSPLPAAPLSLDDPSADTNKVASANFLLPPQRMPSSHSLAASSSLPPSALSTSSSMNVSPSVSPSNLRRNPSNTSLSLMTANPPLSSSNQPQSNSPSLSRPVSPSHLQHHQQLGHHAFVPGFTRMNSSTLSVHSASSVGSSANIHTGAGTHSRSMSPSSSTQALSTLVSPTLSSSTHQNQQQQSSSAPSSSEVPSLSLPLPLPSQLPVQQAPNLFRAISVTQPQQPQPVSSPSASSLSSSQGLTLASLGLSSPSPSPPPAISLNSRPPSLDRTQSTKMASPPQASSSLLAPPSQSPNPLSLNRLASNSLAVPPSMSRRTSSSSLAMSGGTNNLRSPSPLPLSRARSTSEASAVATNVKPLEPGEHIALLQELEKLTVQIASSKKPPARLQARMDEITKRLLSQFVNDKERAQLQRNLSKFTGGLASSTSSSSASDQKSDHQNADPGRLRRKRSSITSSTENEIAAATAATLHKVDSLLTRASSTSSQLDSSMELSDSFSASLDFSASGLFSASTATAASSDVASTSTSTTAAPSVTVISMPSSSSASSSSPSSAFPNSKVSSSISSSSSSHQLSVPTVVDPNIRNKGGQGRRGSAMRWSGFDNIDASILSSSNSGSGSVDENHGKQTKDHENSAKSASVTFISTSASPTSAAPLLDTALPSAAFVPSSTSAEPVAEPSSSSLLPSSTPSAAKASASVSPVNVIEIEPPKQKSLIQFKRVITKRWEREGILASVHADDDHDADVDDIGDALSEYHGGATSDQNYSPRSRDSSSASLVGSPKVRIAAPAVDGDENDPDVQSVLSPLEDDDGDGEHGSKSLKASRMALTDGVEAHAKSPLALVRALSTKRLSSNSRSDLHGSSSTANLTLSSSASQRKLNRAKSIGDSLSSSSRPPPRLDSKAAQLQFLDELNRREKEFIRQERRQQILFRQPSRGLLRRASLSAVDVDESASIGNFPDPVSPSQSKAQLTLSSSTKTLNRRPSVIRFASTDQETEPISTSPSVSLSTSSSQRPLASAFSSSNLLNVPASSAASSSLSPTSSIRPVSILRRPEANTNMTPSHSNSLLKPITIPPSSQPSSSQPSRRNSFASTTSTDALLASAELKANFRPLIGKLKLDQIHRASNADADGDDVELKNIASPRIKSARFDLPPQGNDLSVVSASAESSSSTFASSSSPPTLSPSPSVSKINLRPSILRMPTLQNHAASSSASSSPTASSPRGARTPTFSRANSRLPMLARAGTLRGMHSSNSWKSLRSGGGASSPTTPCSTMSRNNSSAVRLTALSVESESAMRQALAARRKKRDQIARLKMRSQMSTASLAILVNPEPLSSDPEHCAEAHELLQKELEELLTEFNSLSSTLSSAVLRLDRFEQIAEELELAASARNR